MTIIYFFWPLLPQLLFMQVQASLSNIGQRFFQTNLVKKLSPFFFCHPKSVPESFTLKVGHLPTINYQEFNGVPVFISVKHDLSLSAQSPAGFKWALNDLSICNNRMVNWKRDHLITAHKGYLLNRFKLPIATVLLCFKNSFRQYEAIWKFLSHKLFFSDLPV